MYLPEQCTFAAGIRSDDSLALWSDLDQRPHRNRLSGIDSAGGAMAGMRPKPEAGDPKGELLLSADFGRSPNRNDTPRARLHSRGPGSSLKIAVPNNHLA